MEKFCPTERIEGDKIVLGLPQPEAPATQPEVATRSWTLPAIIAAGASALVTLGVYTLFEWLESRGAGTGK